MKVQEVYELPSYDVREFLIQLIEKLDELDDVDFFGREGWRKMLMGDYDGGS